MSGIKGVFKDGWHPKGKDGGKESWRGDFKGINQVAGWVGKGKGKETPREEHVAQPLSSLRDPASFGPPPRRGTAPVSKRVTPDRTPSHDQPTQQYAQRQNVEVEAEEEEGPRPPLPSRMNRTADVDTVNSRPKPSAAPRLPPRLPPRTNSVPSRSPSPPPAYSAPSPSEGYSDGQLNQEATSRLSKAGVSVPALGIGNNDKVGQAPVSELQARFSRMTTNTSSASPLPVPSPSVAEKQAALWNPTKQAPPPPPPRINSNQSMSNVDVEGLNRRKPPPPPPPPKKASIRASPVNAPSPGPPPVPLGTKPR